MELRHPTPDELKPLLEAVDTFVWAWAVKTQSNRRGVVNWKGAIEEARGFPQPVESWGRKRFRPAQF